MSEATEQRSKSKWHWLRTLATLLVCISILASAVAAVVVINQTEPTAQKSNSARKSAALVETITVERGTFSPRLVVLGTVQAAQAIVLSPRVSGPVVELSPKLVPGGMVREGDLILKIDPADFQNALSIRRSELAQAEASREIEQARQRLAEKELKMLEGSIDNTNRSLVMREPQIASIEAEVSAAEAAVERATLDLDRTSVHAPFDAQVLSRSVDIGSQIGPNDELARLVGMEEYWIMAAVPVRSLRWVQFPQKEAPEAMDAEPLVSASESMAEEDPTTTEGSRVILRNSDVWGSSVERHARVARMIGTLDRQTRLARVLIIVDDPLGLNSGEPPLILDSIIETEIEGRPIENVVQLKRDFVRNGNTVWVMQDDKLQIRETEVIFQDLEYAYISKGLDSGDEVVITTLATVAEGVGLKKVNSPPAAESAEENQPATVELKDDNSEEQAVSGRQSAADQSAPKQTREEQADIDASPDAPSSAETSPSLNPPHEEEEPSSKDDDPGKRGEASE